MHLFGSQTQSVCGSRSLNTCVRVVAHVGDKCRRVSPILRASAKYSHMTISGLRKNWFRVRRFRSIFLASLGIITKIVQDCTPLHKGIESSWSYEKERTHPRTNVFCPLSYLRGTRREALHPVFGWFALRISRSTEAFRSCGR